MSDQSRPLKTGALRLATRDGRLHPGLAPPVEGEVVASERGDLTPEEEVARVLGPFLLVGSDRTRDGRRPDEVKVEL